jgi:hypothetical protein
MLAMHCCRISWIIFRHRWTGASAVMNACTLVACTHDILHQVVTQWLRSARAAPDAGNARLQGLCDDGVHSADEDEMQIVLAEPPMPAGAVPAKATFEDWSAFNTRMKGDGRRWAESDPHPRLCILAVANTAVHSLMKALLFASGSGWERLADFRTACCGQPRKYRIAEALRQVHERRSALQCWHLLLDSSHWNLLTADDFTLSNRNLAYRLVSRLAAGLLLLFALPHSTFPFLIFELLIGFDSALLDRLEHEKDCMLDDFSYEHLEFYKNLLDSQDSLLTLAVLAEFLRLDTSNIEVTHSVWQREVAVRHMGTFGVMETSIAGRDSSSFFVAHLGFNRR